MYTEGSAPLWTARVEPIAYRALRDRSRAGINDLQRQFAERAVGE